MRTGRSVSPLRGNPIYTLAQSGTSKSLFKTRKPQIVVNGTGTDLNKREALNNRVKKKMITQKVILSLIDVALKKGEPERVKAYWNTWHCQNRVQSANGRLFGKYCKNRFCTLCSGIRKAEIINKYFPVCKNWKDPYFVTLTVKAVSAEVLKKRIKEMFIAFRKIIDKYRKWHLRSKSIKLIGIKSLECNFNPDKKTYNPHFHIIVPDKVTANLLIQEWCKLWTYKIANSDAQNSKKVKNLEGALIEIIKYSSKIFTEPDPDKVTKQKISPFIYAAALDNILSAMKDHRIFDRFGFDLQKMTGEKPISTLSLNEYKEWTYDGKLNNWVDRETEQLLSDYNPSPELRALLDFNINQDLE